MPNKSETFVPTLRQMLVAVQVSYWFLVPLVASAQPFATGSQFQISSDAYLTYRPDVAAIPGVGFIVVWESDGSPASASFNLQGSLVTADGSRATKAFQVNTFTSGDALFAAVSSDPTGRFVVLWSSSASPGTDDSSRSILAQRFQADGSFVGDPFQVNGYTTSSQSYPDVAMRTDGSFVAVWQSNGSYGTDGSDSAVEGRLFNASGAALDGEFQINTYTTGYQRFPTVALRPGGGFVVVWESDGSAGTDRSSTSVQGRLFDADGLATGEEFQVNTLTASFQRHPSIAVETDGSFVVVWESDGSMRPGDGSTRIRARRYTVNGEALGNPFEVWPETPSFAGFPSVAAAPDGGFAVMWHGQSLRSRLYTADAVARADPIRVTTDGLAGTGPASMVAGPNGDLLAVWSTSSEGVRGRHFSFSCSDDDTLCLNGDRFLVEVNWMDFEGNRGQGRAVGFQSDQAGLFWFFDAANWEVLVKVLDGCDVNQAFWVFASATTNVEFTLRVTDTVTNLERTYFNPLGSAADTITDTGAFATCP